MATLFDQELEKALLNAKAKDPSSVEKILADYVALQNTDASKENLSTFFKTHPADEASTRFLALIDGMTPAELTGFFAIIKRDAAKSEEVFFNNMYLYNYACQEDIPTTPMRATRIPFLGIAT